MCFENWSKLYSVSTTAIESLNHWKIMCKLKPLRRIIKCGDSRQSSQKSNSHRQKIIKNLGLTKSYMASWTKSCRTPNPHHFEQHFSPEKKTGLGTQPENELTALMAALKTSDVLLHRECVKFEAVARSYLCLTQEYTGICQPVCSVNSHVYHGICQVRAK